MTSSTHDCHVSKAVVRRKIAIQLVANKNSGTTFLSSAALKDGLLRHLEWLAYKWEQGTRHMSRVRPPPIFPGSKATEGTLDCFLPPAFMGSLFLDEDHG